MSDLKELLAVKNEMIADRDAEITELKKRLEAAKNATEAIKKKDEYMTRFFVDNAIEREATGAHKPEDVRTLLKNRYRVKGGWNEEQGEYIAVLEDPETGEAFTPQTAVARLRKESPHWFREEGEGGSSKLQALERQHAEAEKRGDFEAMYRLAGEIFEHSHTKGETQPKGQRMKPLELRSRLTELEKQYAEAEGEGNATALFRLENEIFEARQALKGGPKDG